MSFGYRHVYLLGLSFTTFYQATRILRQMGHSQGIPPDGAIFPSGLITVGTQRAVLNVWARSFHSIAPEGQSDRSDDYVDWLLATVWTGEKKKRVALITEIESDLAESS